MHCFFALPLAVLVFMSALPHGTAASTHMRAFMGGTAITSSLETPLDEALKDEKTVGDYHRSLEDEKPRKEPKDEKQKDSSMWRGVSNIPLGLAQLIGITWVLVLGSTPIFIYKMDNRKVTHTGIFLSGLMWAALFGGLFMFTNIIVFQSGHFERERSLTIIECCYFMTQVITTVGYGDITPVFPRGQIFVGIYVLISFFVIALLISEMQTIVVQKVTLYKDILKTKVGKVRSEESKALRAVEFKPEQPSLVNLAAPAILFALIALAWIVFFHFYPGEEKLWTEACYMVLITLTTVGFGAVTPVTEGGMLFSAFFMFIGTAALVSTVTNFSTYTLQRTAWEEWDPKQFKRDLKALRVNLAEDGELSELDFVTFALVQKHLVSKEQMDSIKAAYAAIKPAEGSKIDIEHVATYAGLENVDHSPREGGLPASPVNEDRRKTSAF